MLCCQGVFIRALFAAAATRFAPEGGWELGAGITRRGTGDGEEGLDMGSIVGKLAPLRLEQGNATGDLLLPENGSAAPGRRW